MSKEEGVVLAVIVAVFAMICFGWIWPTTQDYALRVCTDHIDQNGVYCEKLTGTLSPYTR